MPVTRSSSRHASQQPSSLLYVTRRAGPSATGDSKKTPKLPSNEIIVLSSDDDEFPYKGTVSTKKVANRSRKRGVASAATPVPLSDVLEISSDEESATRPVTRKQDKTTKDLQRTIKKLQEELKQSEKQLASTCQEVEELKRYSNKDALSGLGEYTQCEVCTLTMWCPYTLPQCGHSFCETCLIDWFSTTQVQHMTANPQLEHNRAALASQLHAFIQLVPNIHAYGQHGQVHVRAILAELRRHRPEYTCPSCRKEVLNKPVEDFRLKDLVREIGVMMGDKSCPESSHRGSGAFDHFFAAPIMAT